MIDDHAAVTSPHGRRRHRDAKTLQLADNPWIAPPRVFSGEPQYELSNLTPHRRPPDGTRVRPPLGDQAPMPAQQRRRRDDEGPPTYARHQPAGDGEQHTVDGSNRRTACGAPEDREFVPQDDDFEFLELLRPNAKHHELEKPANQPDTSRKPPT